MKLINRTFTGDVPKATKWLFTSSGMFRDACYQFVSMFLLTFVQFCGLGGVSFEEYLAMYAVITVVVIILRIWDGINDPIMGFIIEKCHFKSWLQVNGFKPLTEKKGGLQAPSILMFYINDFYKT